MLLNSKHRYNTLTLICLKTYQDNGNLKFKNGGNGDISNRPKSLKQ